MPDDCSELEGVPNADLLALGMSPQSMKSDNQEYSERPISDLIDLDKYLRQKKTACANPAAAGWGQIRVHKVVPPSSTGSS